MGQFLKVVGTRGELAEFGTETFRFAVRNLQDYTVVYIFSDFIDPYEIGLMHKFHKILAKELHLGTLETEHDQILKMLKREMKV